MSPAMKIPQAMDGESKTFCEQIQRHTSELMKVSLWKRDDIARTNARRRHQQLGSNATHTHYNLKEGDEVSYQGQRYYLGKTTGAAVNRPITADIVTKEGVHKKVQFKDLKPTATPRPAKYYRQELPAVDKLIVWEGDQHLRAGVVIARDEKEHTVECHEHAATTKTSKYWLPLWVTQDGEERRAKKAPAGMAPKNVKVSSAEILVTGELTETFAMSSATKKEAMAKMAV